MRSPCEADCHLIAAINRTIIENLHQSRQNGRAYTWLVCTATAFYSSTQLWFTNGIKQYFTSRRSESLSRKYCKLKEIKLYSVTGSLSQSILTASSSLLFIYLRSLPYKTQAAQSVKMNSGLLNTFKGVCHASIFNNCHPKTSTIKKKKPWIETTHYLVMTCMCLFYVGISFRPIIYGLQLSQFVTAAPF